MKTLDLNCEVIANDADHNNVILPDKNLNQLPTWTLFKKLLFEELGNDIKNHHKVIVIAVHAAFLESGFIGFDPIANKVIDSFHFLEAWTTLFKVSLCYTLPEILANHQADHVVVKFHEFGGIMDVYGSIYGEDSKRTSFRVITLNADDLVTFLNVVWGIICGTSEKISYTLEKSFSSFLMPRISNQITSCEIEKISEQSVEKEVSKFWRNVKDNLVLPLLMNICERNGLDLPSCFMKLPNDLKLKIMEILPSVGLAKLGCVCLELRDLASSKYLWRLKVEQEFPADTPAFQGSWKNVFVRKSKMKKKISRKLFLLSHEIMHWPYPEV